MSNTLAENYADALKEFETLTNKRAATLKNKGKEDGIKKLAVMFKSGKTLDQRVAEYEAAIVAVERSNGPDALKALKNLQVARDKLVEGFRKNITDFTAQARVLGPSDAELKTGFEVFLKRMGQLSNRAKMETEQRANVVKGRTGQAPSPDAKLRSDIKATYLNIKKGCDETEALMKVFIARPTKETFTAAFSSSTGPRSISVAVTGWKQLVLKKQPDIARRLRADPEHLLQKIYDLTQKKDPAYWNAKLQMDQPGWEGRAKVVATMCLDQVKNWRMMADDIKALVA